ncbi:hypothetical protein BDZ85DRAFT_282647 [Elsinoe ampelina]|uniref:Uncharacterized protein n=1 Tax=Elsinoe ampelina TaxID=302913 RepID=A0A6A6GA21_9PEZI|nr:hypothetical protein BDZ85DRAFT_282647 [Elsinoe ampelina]
MFSKVCIPFYTTLVDRAAEPLAPGELELARISAKGFLLFLFDMLNEAPQFSYKLDKPAGNRPSLWRCILFAKNEELVTYQPYLVVLALAIQEETIDARGLANALRDYFILDEVVVAQALIRLLEDDEYTYTHNTVVDLHRLRDILDHTRLSALLLYAALADVAETDVIGGFWVKTAAGMKRPGKSYTVPTDATSPFGRHPLQYFLATSRLGMSPEDLQALKVDNTKDISDVYEFRLADAFDNYLASINFAAFLRSQVAMSEVNVPLPAVVPQVAPKISRYKLAGDIDLPTLHHVEVFWPQHGLDHRLRCSAAYVLVMLNATAATVTDLEAYFSVYKAISPQKTAANLFRLLEARKHQLIRSKVPASKLLPPLATKGDSMSEDKQREEFYTWRRIQTARLTTDKLQQVQEEMDSKYPADQVLEVASAGLTIVVRDDHAPYSADFQCPPGKPSVDAAYILRRTFAGEYTFMVHPRLCKPMEDGVDPALIISSAPSSKSGGYANARL